MNIAECLENRSEVNNHFINGNIGKPAKNHRLYYCRNLAASINLYWNFRFFHLLKIPAILPDVAQ